MNSLQKSITMKKNFFSSLLAILIFAMATVSCKKEEPIKPEADASENINWSLFQVIFYYPDLYHSSEITNSVWTFSSDHQIRIFSPLKYIQEENGEWNRTADNKIVIDINNPYPLKYTRSFDIILETESFMQLETKDEHYKGSHGITSKVRYVFYKIE